MFRRVVFDTSTLVSAALRIGSTPHHALECALSGSDLFVSASTLAELEEVLMRPKFDQYLISDLRADFAAIIRQHSTLIAVPEAAELNVLPSCRDPKDNKFLALAAKCGAQVLVSSDADLLVLHPWNGVAILNPEIFIREQTL
jgi:putative PIN family toxin of toxin-antitoxin system